jgi:hypothetical protein
MAAYVLHLVDRQQSTLMTAPGREPHSFDFLFEVLTGPFAGERGTHRELSDLLREQIVVMSGTVGLCHTTGAILDWRGSREDGRWVPRHGAPMEQEVGGHSW